MLGFSSLSELSISEIPGIGVIPFVPTPARTVTVPANGRGLLITRGARIDAIPAVDRSAEVLTGERTIRLDAYQIEVP